MTVSTLNKTSFLFYLLLLYFPLYKINKTSPGEEKKCKGGNLSSKVEKTWSQKWGGEVALNFDFRFGGIEATEWQNW